MEESREIRNMRNMAWERAKGELRSIYHTFWGHESRLEDFQGKTEDFINKIEIEGLHE